MERDTKGSGIVEIPEGTTKTEEAKKSSPVPMLEMIIRTNPEFPRRGETEKAVGLIVEIPEGTTKTEAAKTSSPMPMLETTSRTNLETLRRTGTQTMVARYRFMKEKTTLTKATTRRMTDHGGDTRVVESGVSRKAKCQHGCTQGPPNETWKWLSGNPCDWVSSSLHGLNQIPRQAVTSPSHGHGHDGVNSAPPLDDVAAATSSPRAFFMMRVCP